LEESSTPVVTFDINNPSSSKGSVAIVIVFEEILSIIHENEAISPMKSE